MSLAGRLRSWGRYFLPPGPERRLRRYDSFAAAADDCDGYQDAELVLTVCRKTERFRAGLETTAVPQRQTLQNLFVMLYASRGHPLEVVELGGACGAAFFDVDRWLPGLVTRWSVVETPAMVRVARPRFEGDRLLFVDQVSAVGEGHGVPRLFMAQGSLPYVADAAAVLESAAGMGFEFLYVTRTPVLEDETFLVVARQEASIRDHGPGAAPADVPGRLLSQPIVLLSRRFLSTPPPQYEIAVSFEEGPEADWEIGHKRLRVRDRGVLMRRRQP